MRIVLFYSEVESFNCFTDQLVKEFTGRGHETFILDLMAIDSQKQETYEPFLAFITQKVDAAVCFDGLGAREDMFIQVWDGHDAVVIDIMLDPPLRFHPTLEKHPKKYHLLCCDRNHVAYIKKYFGGTVSRVEFMPHAGVLPETGAKDQASAGGIAEEPVIPWKDRTYEILFCGTYYRPEDQFVQLSRLFPEGSTLYGFYQYVYRILVEDSSLSVDQGVELAAEQVKLLPSWEEMKILLRCSEHVDWAIRMYQRGRVVQTLADAGFELYLLGRGWENHPSADCLNVHRIDDRVPFEKTFAHMADAKINLNVMPGFKAGTHERIFNILLRHSLPLTDSSSWIDEHFTDGEDIALYDLKFLEQLPFLTDRLLSHPARTEEMIRRGYEKVARNYTWSNCADRILETIEEDQKIVS